MEYFKLTIVVDHNDGDYVTGISKISAEDLEEFINPVAKALKEIREKRKNTYFAHNWNRLVDSSNEESPYIMYKELLTHEQIDSFNDFLPYSENEIHSIHQISVTPWVKEKTMFSRFA